MRKLGYPQSAADVSAGTVPYFGHADFDPGNPKIAQAPLYARPLIYNGFAIWRSNHLPTTNVTEGPVKYQGDFTNTEGIVWQPDAIGVLQMGGIDQETARLTTRKCDFYVASMLMGGGALRPYLAVELASA